MKADSQKQLSDDLLADALAHSRQRIRGGKTALVGITLLSCAALLLLRQSPPLTSPLTQTSPLPNNSEPPLKTKYVDEFDPLLDQLADAGPIIITLPNGTRELILTR